jgi:hypothetical protein
VTSGSTPVCTITLSVGSGSCSPGRVAFDAGTHPLVSTYTGDMSDAAAVTPSASLVVTGPRVYWPLAWLRMERLYLSHIGEATHWDAWLLFVNRV